MINADDIKRNIEIVQARIRAFDSGVKLLAVSKTVSCEAVDAAISAGLREFGESKVQEAEAKIAVINASNPGISWHFIGHLQTNKAAKAAGLFDCIQSIDSVKIAEKVSFAAAGKIINTLLEVKISQEDTKFGINPESIAAVIEGVKKLKGIRVTGLMTMAPYSDNPENARPYFRKAKRLFDGLKRTACGGNISMETLSMGMSGDYGVAIEEGSTMVRIGSGIFGERIY